jgi:hypothetical protein
MATWFCRGAILPSDEEQLLPPDLLFKLWTALRLDEDLAYELACKMRLLWDGEARVLRVCKRWAASASLFEAVSGALWSIWRFRLFSDSRWLTVGSCCRALVAAQLTGVCALVSHIKVSRGSQYYIGGYSKVTGRTTQFAIIAALASHVPDAACAFLMEDGRVAKMAAKLKDRLIEKLTELEELDIGVYELINDLLLRVDEPLPMDSCASRLRSDVLSAAYLARAFIHTRVLAQLEEFPWSLATGDQVANIDSLVGGPKPREPTAGKVWELCYPEGRYKMSREKVKAALDLLLEVNWHTVATEQSHSLAACIRRMHPEMQVLQLISRSVLLGMCKVLPGITNLEKELEKCERKFEALWSRRTGHITARNIFISELLECASSWKALRGRDLPARFSQLVVRSAGVRFNALDERSVQYFEHRAASKRSLAEDSLQEKRIALNSRVVALRRKAVEQAVRSVPISLSCCKLSQQRAQDLRGLLDRSSCTLASCAAAAHNLSTCASRVGPLVASDSALMVHGLPVHAPKAPWVDSVCLYRHAFRDSVLVFDIGADMVYYKFHFAFKSPRFACFTPLAVLPPLEADAFFNEDQHILRFRMDVHWPLVS